MPGRTQFVHARTLLKQNVVLYLITSPPLHLFTSPPLHLSTSSPLHLFTSPPLHLSTSPPLHLSTSSPLSYMGNIYTQTKHTHRQEWGGALHFDKSKKKLLFRCKIQQLCTIKAKIYFPFWKIYFCLLTRTICVYLSVFKLFMCAPTAA